VSVRRLSGTDIMNDDDDDDDDDFLANTIAIRHSAYRVPACLRTHHLAYS
jgi:hypothetical protein